MIISKDILNNKIEYKIKYFNDITSLINIVNTDGEMGVVCYIQNDLNKEKSFNKDTNNMQNNNFNQTWQPFNIAQTQKIKFKVKSYGELINSLPPLKRDSISDIRGKFYNTFDTPVEINENNFISIFSIKQNGKNAILERTTYYLITDVQELERSFNSNIMPCTIINFNALNEEYDNKQVDESLKYLIQEYLINN